MTDTVNLGLPTIAGSQAQKHVTHNEALRVLDALVMPAVLDRDLAAPPASPAEGARYIVKAPATGGFAGHDDAIAHFADGGWSFYPPRTGWTCYVADEGRLLAWNGSAWVVAIEVLGAAAIQNLGLLGLGTTADAANPLSAKLNNALLAAKTAGEGGDGDLRLKLSKESAADTASLLFQDNFSGRAELGLTGDDDFHLKVSADGTAWTDALTVDRASGAAKLNSGLFLTGDLAPPQLTADQNDYNPAGLAAASVLRLTADAARTVTGLAGGGDGRLVALMNAGAYPITLANEAGGSAAANRFVLANDLTLAPKQAAMLIYDAAASRWRMLAAAEPPPLHGQCRLAKSGSNLVLTPFNGNRIVVNRLPRTIWSPAGVTLGAAGLAAGTLYYIYLFANAAVVASRARTANVATLASAAAHNLGVGSLVNVTGVGGGYDGVAAVTAVTATTFSYANAGANESTVAAGGAVEGLTLEAAATGHATDVNGVEIKAGDPSRTLVGMARPVAGPAFADANATRFVASWFNRRLRAVVGAELGGATTASTASFVELSSTCRAEFLAWGDGVKATFNGQLSNSGSSYTYVGIGIDSAAQASNGGTLFGSVGMGMSASYAGEPAEGYHYLTPIGQVGAGTGTYFGKVFAELLI